MPTILVTGAASGLGAEFVRQYKQDQNNTIIAVDRVKIPTTNRLIENYVVDNGSQESINLFKKQMQDRPIDLIIHSAGIRGLVPAIESEKPNDVAACETMGVMDLETLMKAFQVNAAGTFMLLRALVPNLEASGCGKVVVMSSRMGSVGNNQVARKDAGSAYAYRASKAALNTIVRSLAVDVSKVVWVLCHPGRVESGLVKGKEEGAISAAESVQGIIPMIGQWGTSDTGRFYDRFGEVIEW